ncbi:MAG: 30S ribosomal protein S3 [Clostridiales Family XIII bacterium]|uniref:30S ribosomal protein S3 n=1 Tax=Hominibacterium faecale TaxID=2839743 RepID=UPI001D128A24|nr:30S ribosomal protein S3 [Hominibacterium faecale]MCC2866084.1 30S ribosomal protein S3 [Anaerovorax odorimutans]MCI7303222.1 30S ribosomal protein S3 [Clostridia bacterium]MDE8732035.1 30S ribosomal protein S3 [Eubacteriales bacterium DFI.9.88]MDY3010384.1 30S ribosomal protein S3 [Clostridiales Family XIII bacterium]
MGQKVSPHGLRVGIIKDWDSKWYADKGNFADYLIEDNKVREFVKKKLYVAGVSKILLERQADNKLKVIVLTAKPGMVIGRSGNGIDELKSDLEKMTGKAINIEIKEVRRSELDAQLTAESIAQALERRISFRRAMKQAIGRTMKAGAKGIKVLVSGRLGGAEIARNEKYSEGNVPLHTLRADIDYGFAEADTTYGKIGVKVWINHGEILDKGLKSAVRDEGNGRRDGKRNRRDGDRRPRRDNDRRRNDRRRDDKPELPKAVNPRKRKAPKEEPAKAAEAQTTEAQVDAATEAATTEE